MKLSLLKLETVSSLSPFMASVSSRMKGSTIGCRMNKYHEPGSSVHIPILAVSSYTECSVMCCVFQLVPSDTILCRLKDFKDIASNLASVNVYGNAAISKTGA